MAVEYETEIGFGPSTAPGPYREADYQALPDEPRCELLYGRLVVTPAPSLRHQRTILALSRILYDYSVEHGGEVALSPLDVRLADHSIVQPDLIYVSPARAEILQERIFGAPDLVVEILSPSTARRDRGAKLQLYAESDVREYWLVDPESETIEFLVNEAGHFRVELPLDGRYHCTALSGLELDLAAFWSQVKK
jgi:Uma2 family endonuclease